MARDRSLHVLLEVHPRAGGHGALVVQRRAVPCRQEDAVGQQGAGVAVTLPVIACAAVPPASTGADAGATVVTVVRIRFPPRIVPAALPAERG